MRLLGDDSSPSSRLCFFMIGSVRKLLVVREALPFQAKSGKCPDTFTHNPSPDKRLEGVSAL